MTFEVALSVPFVALFLAMGAWSWLVSRSPTRLAKQGEQFARRNLAFVDEAYIGEFDARRAARLRFVALCCVCAAAAIPFTTPSPGEETWAVYPLLILLTLGNAAMLGHQVLDTSRPFRLPPGEAVARLREVSVGDLVSPSRRLLSAVAALATAVMAATLIWARLTDHWDGPDPAWWGLTVALLLLVGCTLYSRVAARRMVRAGEPAADLAALYWQDALRAESVNLAYRLAITGFYVACFSAGAGIEAPPGAEGPFSAFFLCLRAIGFGLFLIDLVLMMREHSHPSRLWFRRRLWPDLAPGQVLTPQLVEAPR